MARPFDAATRVYCISTYPAIEDVLPSFTTVFQSVIIFILAIVIEIVVNGVHQPSPTNPTATESGQCCTILPGDTHPSPQKRARKLVIATLWMVPLCIMFAWRAQGLGMPKYPQKCIDNTDVAYRNWVVISIVNFLPFSMACTAWLRALVDCVLVRFDTALSRDLWPPLLPIVGPVKIIIKAIAVVSEAFTRCLVYSMGGDVPKSRVDIEMNVSEEERGLVGNMEGNGDEGEEHPPAYEVGGPSSDLEIRKEPRKEIV